MSNGRGDFQDVLNKALQEAFELGNTRRERAGTTYGKGAIVPNSHREKLMTMYNAQSLVDVTSIVSKGNFGGILEMRECMNASLSTIADAYAESEKGQVAISQIENISAQVDIRDYHRVTIEFSGRIIILPKSPRIE